MLKNKLKYLLLILIFLALYTFRLDKVPVHLNQDEAMFALNAKDLTPSFYFWHLNAFWATPIIVYWTAIFLKFLPVSEIFIRLPSVFAGLISVILTVVLVRKVLKNNQLALLAGVLLAVSPAFFINSRLLLDNIYIVPFVLLWLILIDVNPFLSGLFLGLGFHSYHAAKIYMPLYLVATLVYGYMAKWSWKKLLLTVAGFAIPILLFLPWLKAHPDTLTNQISYASSIDSNLGSNFVKNYFSYFDPRILFVEGDRTLVHSTGNTGVFPFPAVFLLVFGIFYAIRQKDLFSKLILFGFLIFPVAPAIINDPGRISRSLVVLPFGILLATYGIKFFLGQKDKIFKFVLWFIFAASLFQFVFFLTDYFGSYRSQSWRVFNGDVGGVMESALRSTKMREVQTIYLDKYIPHARFYYEFYEKKLGITFENVMDYDFKEDGFSDLPAGSLLVSGRKIEDVEPIEIIREPDGTESYFVYEKIK